MFERFTADSREVVIGAVRVAAELGSAETGTEHVLVALTADPGPAGRTLRAAGVVGGPLRVELAGRGGSGDTAPGVDADALSAIGIDYDAVRRAVERTFGPGALHRDPAGARRRRWRRRPRPCGGHRPFTAHAKRALERSLREALALRDRHIRSEHLLLGIIGSGAGATPMPTSAATRLLRDRGVDLPQLRDAVLAERRRQAS